MDLFDLSNLYFLNLVSLLFELAVNCQRHHIGYLTSS